MLAFSPEIIRLYTNAGYTVDEVGQLRRDAQDLTIVRKVGENAIKLREALLGRHSSLPFDLQENLLRHVIDRIAIEAISPKVLDATFQNLDLFGRANFTAHQIAEIAIKSKTVAEVKEFASEAEKIIQQKDDLAIRVDSLTPSENISWAEIAAHITARAKVSAAV